MTREARYSITISLYNDITIERYYRRHDNQRINVSPYTEKVTARMSQQSDSPFPASLSNSDCLQNPPMPSCRPIETNASCAILAQRLLQLACIILHSLMRLITSDKSSRRYPRPFQSQQAPLYSVT